MVHREALRAHLGEAFDDSLRSLHRCDNPPCFNPRHLFQGTPQDNTHDMLLKGRHSQSMGGSVSALNTNDVLEIRHRHAMGETQSSIAASVGLSPSGVSGIVRRARWKHV